MPSETAKNYISHLLASALSSLKLTSELDSLDITVPPNPAFGDYSSNAGLVLARKIKANPKEVAQKIIEEINKIDLEKNFEPLQEKGGFINFTFSQKFLSDNLNKILEQGDLYGASIFGQGKTVIVEYFQNNVAKPPHVGHLRSAVIGDCLLRVLKSQGYKAVSDTHVGDWGVQFGILLYAFKTLGNKAAVEKDPINELNKLYVEMSAKIETDKTLRDKGKEEFLKLEKGGTENRELWQWFVRVSLEDFEKYRQLLDILPFDHNLGESFYEDKMPAVIADLKSKGLLKESQGAHIVDLEDVKKGVAIIIKSGGGTMYLTRDLATIKYREEQFKPAKILYVVDNRQSHHFEQIFEISQRVGYIKDKSSVEHVDLGFMSLPEGAISTRKGTTISLQNLIDEAQKRALAIIEQKNPGLMNKQAVAQLVALAAIKYFDLSHNRKTEIVFTWDKALSFEGNTGPYLQYTYARIQGILRKTDFHWRHSEGVQPTEESLKTDKGILHPSDALRVQDDATVAGLQSAILRKLIQFPEVVAEVARDYYPNNLCNYLFELSQTFNAFYQEVPVLQEPNQQLKLSRLNLITATAQVISNGLYLLGIEAPEEM